MAVAALLGLAAALAPVQARSEPADWQQGIEYRIEARLDEETDVLHGRARVYYRNDSPDTLRTFWFHLSLNAFRPNSLWARTDLTHGITTFQELGPEDWAYQHVRAMTADERVVELRYPHAPDSTVVGFDLPDPLAPGETLVLDYAWDARLSTLPRRQGRRGRHYDFAQWYPRVVVYDEQGWRVHPLYRQGEFYGEFATYDVTLDVRDDQVLGATGVPVEGDPGWEGAAALGTGPIDYQREWYGSLAGPPCIQRGGERICNEFPARRLPAPEALGELPEAVAAGRKRVRWRAEDVHHFAWTASPDYTYEQGRWQDISIHVLYQPGDAEAWGGGVTVRRTALALAWLDGVFGDFAYPQLTNVHRIEGGGTEFPMMIMDGSASQSLIVHEAGHNYAYAILANNQWYEGWLDEGLTSFQTDWFLERAGGGGAVWEEPTFSVLVRDLLGMSEPLVLPAEAYRDYSTYSSMIYTKGEVVFWMLRELAGDEAMLRILRTYYDRYRLRRVDSQAFREVAEEVLGRDLGWFFGQWLYGTGVVDYGLDDVSVTRDADGWRTSLELERKGDLVMPVPVRFTSASGASRDVTLEGTALERRFEVHTDFEPVRVVLDPEGTILDWDVADNGWAPGPFSNPLRHLDLGNPLEPVPASRHTTPVELFPLLWANDAGGWVGGIQVRSAKLGLVDRRTLRLGLPAIEAGEKGGLAEGTDVGSLYFRVENPVVGRRPGMGTRLEGFAGEGRWLAAGDFARGDPREPDGARLRLSGVLYGVYDDAYLVPGRWSPAAGLATEVGLGLRAPLEGDGTGVVMDVGVAGGFDSRDRRWVRGAATLEVAGEVGEGWTARGRVMAGAVLGRAPEVEGGGEASTAWKGDNAPRERMFFLAGGDPLQAISNPWVRSAGAPLVEHGFVPGGGELRGFHPGVALPAMGAVGAELLAPAWTFGSADGRWSLRPLAFGGVAVGAEAPAVPGAEVEDVPFSGGIPDGLTEPVEGGHAFYSVGVGLEVAPQRSPLRLRVDVPFLVSDPDLAATAEGSSAGLRWTVSVLGG